jgi:hypothetical protein
MQFGVWATLVALGVYATDRWAIRRQAVYPMTLTAMSVFSYLTIRGTRVTANIGGVHTERYPYLGLLWLFLALASIIAAYVHWQWGLPGTGENETVDNDATESTTNP